MHWMVEFRHGLCDSFRLYFLIYYYFLLLFLPLLVVSRNVRSFQWLLCEFWAILLRCDVRTDTDSHTHTPNLIQSVEYRGMCVYMSCVTSLEQTNADHALAFALYRSKNPLRAKLNDPNLKNNFFFQNRIFNRTFWHFSLLFFYFTRTLVSLLLWWVCYHQIILFHLTTTVTQCCEWHQPAGENGEQRQRAAHQRFECDHARREREWSRIYTNICISLCHRMWC